MALSSPQGRTATLSSTLSLVPLLGLSFLLPANPEPQGLGRNPLPPEDADIPSTVLGRT